MCLPKVLLSTGKKFSNFAAKNCLPKVKVNTGEELFKPTFVQADAERKVTEVQFSTADESLAIHIWY